MLIYSLYYSIKLLFLNSLCPDLVVIDISPASPHPQIVSAANDKISDSGPESDTDRRQTSSRACRVLFLNISLDAELHKPLITQIHHTRAFPSLYCIER